MQTSHLLQRLRWCSARTRRLFYSAYIPQLARVNRCTRIVSHRALAPPASLAPRDISVSHTAHQAKSWEKELKLLER